jgi:aminoacyl tRNA synthase complex-interacting multifunctional protein 1
MLGNCKIIFISQQLYVSAESLLLLSISFIIAGSICSVRMSSSSSSKSARQLLDDLIAEIEVSTPGIKEENKGSKDDKSKEKKEKPAKREKPVPAPTAADEPISINSIDLRVGVIVGVTKHETADKLYCEEIDVGEEEPRAIASGLVPHYTLEEMQGRRIIVICNLVPRKLVGFKSNGMVLCAAKSDGQGGEKVEFIDPPADAKVGERIVGEGLKLHEPLPAKQCDKKKAFEIVAADLRVDADGIAVWKDIKLVTVNSKGTSSAPTLRDAVAR